MKTMLRFHSLIFFLFFFAFPTSNLAKELLDVDGDWLKNGGSYYILPAFKDGGGLELTKVGSEICPLTVVQARSETRWGMTARIWTPARIGILKPSFFVNFEFQPQKPFLACEPSSRLQWKVDKETQTVKIASAEEEKMWGPFEIHPYRDHYKLVYCDTGSQANSDDDDCKNLGISIDDENNRRLVVKDGDPFVVRFVKAKGNNYDPISIIV